MSESKSTSVKEILEGAAADRAKVFGNGLDGVQADNGWILLDGWYEIDMDRLKTKESLLNWIAHLLGKKWVTTKHLRWVIKLASEKHGYSPFGSL